MTLFESIPYTIGEKDFEIRIYYDETSINVAAFLLGYPANGYRFKITVPKKCDVKMVLEKYPVPDLVEICKKKIQENHWDSFSKIISDNMIE